LAFYLAVLAMATIAPAQSPSTEAWKKKHDLGNRYEGLIDIQTGNPTLELLSFTGYFRPFDGKQEWRVEFFSPARTAGIVIAREVEEQHQYWMESKPIQASPQQWSKFNGWNTGDVLVPTEAAPSNIGITVRISAGEVEYLPAFVFPANARPISIAVESYNLQLRSDRPLDQVKYSISGKRQGRRLSTTGNLGGTRPSTLSFLVKLDARPFDEGPLKAEIQGYFRGRMINTIEVRSFHRRTFQ